MSFEIGNTNNIYLFFIVLQANDFQNLIQSSNSKEK